MTKQEYISYVENRYNSKGLEERYEHFKKDVIFDNGMTLKDFIFVMAKYNIIREAHSWTELHHFVDLLKFEIGEIK